MSLENGKLNRRDFLKITGNAVLANLISNSQGSEQIKDIKDIPNEESIISTFAEILNGQEAKERRRVSDENGTYLWEIEFPVEDGMVELGFMRKGKHETGGFNIATKIYVTFFDTEGVPEGGHDVAEFAGDTWSLK